MHTSIPTHWAISPAPGLSRKAYSVLPSISCCSVDVIWRPHIALTDECLQENQSSTALPAVRATPAEALSRRSSPLFNDSRVHSCPTVLVLESRPSSQLPGSFMHWTQWAEQHGRTLPQLSLHCSHLCLSDDQTRGQQGCPVSTMAIRTPDRTGGPVSLTSRPDPNTGPCMVGCL